MKLYSQRIKPFPTYRLKRAHVRNGVRYIPTSYFEEVNSWLVSAALRYFNSLQREAEHAGTTFVLPSVDEVEDYLRDLLQENRVLITGRHTLKDDTALERLVSGAKGAATFALSTFDPTYRARAAELGRKGKRVSKLSPLMLSRVDHLSKAKQADRLKLSSSTIARLRPLWYAIKALREQAQQAKANRSYPVSTVNSILTPTEVLIEGQQDLWALVEQPSRCLVG